MPPWGAFGGQDAAGSSCTVTSGDQTTRLPSKVTTFVQQGDRLATVTPGGGGWGDPLRRDVNLVRRDVREGLISVERAREVYGVVLDPKTLELDRDATRARRESAGGSI